MSLTSDDLVNGKEPSPAPSLLYRFAQFTLDARRRTLSRNDSPVPLTARAFDVLLFLVQNPNRLVTKDELLVAVWGDLFVEEGNLTQHIWHIRKALSDNSDDVRLIVTIARKGYQLTADVSVDGVPDAARQNSTQASAARSLPVDEHRVPPAIADEPLSRYGWRKPALAYVSLLVLAVVGFVGWQHFAGATQHSPKRVMLAVLPFENLTGDPNKEYLADGLTEQTISQLGRLNPEQLGVIARTSVMGYKHQNTRLDQVGRDLSVEYVLENSIRESGNRLRVTAQLIQIKDQTHLWSRDYDYAAGDVLSVQDDLAKAIGKEIRLRLTAQQHGELPSPHTVIPEAFNAYLQGYYFFERNTDTDTDMAAKYFETATQLDPSYAPAWVGLSRARKWQAVRGMIPRDEGYLQARRAAERALVLSPKLAEAHDQMGRVQQQIDFDWAAANASFAKAVELEPNNPEPLRLAAYSADFLGDFDKAITLSRRAIDADPLNAESWEALGETELYMGQLDQAAVDLKHAIQLNPDFWNSHIFLSEVYILQGRPQDALPEIERVRFAPFRAWLYSIASYALGRRKESDAALTELVTKYHATSPCLIADVYAYRKQSDEAFRWLDQAYTSHNDGLVTMKHDRFLRSLHDDPRYTALLKKLNLPN